MICMIVWYLNAPLNCIINIQRQKLTSGSRNERDEMKKNVIRQ